jgi:DNA polymerase-3 subunit delta
MKLSLDQLPLHLKNNLLPVYFISGDELLLVQEARDLIHHAANQNGYLET